MNESLITGYCMLSVLVTIVDLYFARKSFGRPTEIGRYLGFSAIAAATVTLSYLLSVLTESHLGASIASSIYFASIDWMLIFLVHFVMLVTRRHGDELSIRLRRIVHLYAIFDSAVFVVNTYGEIAIGYVPRDTPIAHFAYQMQPLYICHLLFTYILVGVITFLLVDTIARTPAKYRSQFLYLLAAILAVVAVNAIFLYPTANSIFSLLDLSVFGYSIGLYFMYWAAFDYREKDMLESLSMTIFENIGQGIVLFDYNGELIMHNAMAERLLPHVSFPQTMTIDSFVDACDLPTGKDAQKDTYSLQSLMGTERNTPMRVDFRRLRDDADQTVTGNLFVFSDVTEDIDMLTGFQHWESFRKFAAENPWSFDHPTAVAIFDIIGLGEVNQTFGRAVGDQRIRNLVKIMRDCMPSDTYYVRGYEAHLVAICPLHEEHDILPCVESVIETCGPSVVYGLSSTADRTVTRRSSYRVDPMAGSSPYNYALHDTESRNITQAIERASRAMQVKKLLESSSHRSHAITSLVRALQESDGDTEAHVKRTQRMGELLGRRIGLDDAELADLRLLCLLHDIGKIGIPLEILNKPGRLTDDEWSVLRSHAEKGFQIAMSSSELRPIAPMILHHHEQWDGKGYPQGIAGEDIPLLSRFIAVVDTYDAMVNTRAYRKALPPEVAKEEIRRCSGTQFDPLVAAQFLLMLDENPELALGENTGGFVAPTEPAPIAPTPDGDRPPNSYAIDYARYVLDIDDNIVETDEAFEQLTGYSAQDAVGKMCQTDLIPPEDRTDYFVLVSKQFSRASSVYIEHDIVRKDGSRVHVFCYGKRFYDSALKVFRSEVIVFDASKTHAAIDSQI